MAANFNDAGAYWRSDFEDPTYNDTMFQQQIEDLWRQVLPLYEQLHAYVRRKLRSKYPGKFDNLNAIPAHILGILN